MLVLVRRIGESVVIGDAVTVKILGIRSGQIKIGIEAPGNLPVHRQEIYARIRLQREENAHPARDH